MPNRQSAVSKAIFAFALLLAVVAAVPAQAAIAFRSPARYPRPAPKNLATADWDGDGKVDLAVLIARAVSLYYGKGDGTFETPVDMPLEQTDQWGQVRGVDVNHDGRPDLVVTEFGLDKVLIFMNRGGRAFAPADHYTVGSSPAGFVAGDFNGDGKVDLATSNHNGRNLSVLLNRGDGTFQAPTAYPGTGGLPGKIVSADFNGDGKADLAMSHYISDDVIVHLGDGTGRFTSAGGYKVGAYPGIIVTDDFNGDGRPDLATGDAFSDSVSVLFNDGGGKFRAAIAFRCNYPYNMTTADVDGDGDPELVVPITGSGDFSVLENPGTGFFLPPVQFTTDGVGTIGLTTGDFNGDGRPDVAIANETSGTVDVFINETPRPSPAVRTLVIEPAGFVGGCGSANGVVTLTLPAPAGGAVVSLSSSNPAILVPATVTIPAGAISAPFSVAGVPVTGVQSGTVLATFNNTSQRVSLTVRPIGIIRLTLTSLQLAGGKPANGELTLDCQAPMGGLLVTLSSSHSALRVPASVLVPAGATAATFAVTTDFVAAPIAVTVTASYGGLGRTATLTLLPDPPTAAPAALVATAVAPGQIRLTWSDNSSNETSFEIERKSGTGAFTRIASVAANTSSFIDSGLAPNTTFTYRVRAVNASAASTYSNEANATTPPDPPAAPTQLTATGSSSSQITLTWRDNSGNETGFEIERKTDGAPFTRIGTVAANVTGYVDTGLDPGSTHRYRVRAVNGSGVSPYSNEASATTLSAPAVPAAPVQRIAVFRPETREWFLREADGSTTLVSFGGPGDAPVPADYLGIGSAQVAVFRPATREWFLRAAGGLTIPVFFPAPGETPVPADYLGLGRAQIAVYRAAAGEWYLRNDNGTATILPFGGPADVPVPADYFGIGRAQLAVFRPATGEWFLRTDGGGTITVPWGAPGDLPIPADYLGLGRAQLAVYRSATAEFFLRDDLGTATRIALGTAGDVPVPGNYLGTGRAQFAVFHPATAEWLVRADNGTVTRIQWGAATDVPVPAPFAPRVAGVARER